MFDLRVPACLGSISTPGCTTAPERIPISWVEPLACFATGSQFSPAHYLICLGTFESKKGFSWLVQVPAAPFVLPHTIQRVPDQLRITFVIQIVVSGFSRANPRSMLSL